MNPFPGYMEPQKKEMIGKLRAMGFSEKVLNAFDARPRHWFDQSFKHSMIYEIAALPSQKGQTISNPATVALQTQLLNVQPGDKILEIGTGTGFQSAILDFLGARVFTIERDYNLASEANKLFKYFENKIFSHYGDGYEGLPRFAPFDKVLITCAPPDIPEKLLDQLKVGGFMITPIGVEDKQKMLKITKLDDENFECEELGDCFFVPMLRDKV
ncbi:protein-L-isoaspartate O-methyltransferase [Bacteroidales bacterium OttesenSCG-928-B11]|nr:protein-L-isoaspartate O-methyltransferase [Bacteroidales bacterium OttesenSCG-928-B11]